MTVFGYVFHCLLVTASNLRCVDGVRKEYFATVSDKNGDHLDLSEGSDSEAPGAAVDDTEVPSSTDSGTRQNTEDTTLNQSSADVGDFITSVKSFLERGCSCVYGKSKSLCTESLSLEELVEHRMQCIELSSTELDLVVLGALNSFMNLSSGKKRHRMCYFFRSVQVCKKTFLFVYGIGKYRLENLKAHLKRHGIAPRTHGNTARLPKNALAHETLNRAVTFVKNFASEQAVALPGRVPNFKNLKVQLLPSCESKASVWRRYIKASEENNLNAVSYTKFVALWNTLTPYIVIMTPASDLCSLCQLNNAKITKNVNVTEQEKLSCLRDQETHLHEAKTEREFMKTNIAACKEVLQGSDIDLLTGRPSCSFKGTMHYSYDYAQQVHIPSNPQQPGPIYFKTPRKCGLFGICCEGIPRQVNYLIDEAVATGKGANSTISYVHHFFSTHGAGETDVQINADNCGGQNKNNFVIWYYCWRVLCALHDSVLYSFLIAGHTKFSPDWCFGLIKQSFRRRYVSSLFDLMEAVDQSTITGVNISELCGLHDGTVKVPVYDWVTFLGPYFKKIPGISKFHHFRLTKEHPGVVFCRKLLSSEEIEFQILKDPNVRPPIQLPQQILPLGLDNDRKRYLFREIREFCRPGTEDLVAPAP